MATLVFSAIGASIGSSALSGVLGTGIGSLIGRSAGGVLGRTIDQALFGKTEKQQKKSSPLGTLMVATAHEGAPIPQYFGRYRAAGHLIWASPFRTEETKNGYRYRASFAFALCEGTVQRVGRIWFEDQEINQQSILMHFFSGSDDQPISHVLAMHEGAINTPAYRGLSYVVFEDLDLTPFGNRIPNFQFEIFRAPKNTKDEVRDLVRGVALIPGSGEYVYSTSKVEVSKGLGQDLVVNRSRRGGNSDFTESMNAMVRDLPNLKSVSLVTSWFGNDLRIDKCEIKPKVSDRFEGNQKWCSGGISRQQAELTSKTDNRPNYGGTPSDQSVIEAIQALHQYGLDVMFYPFILMDIPSENQLPSPDGQAHQPAHPWRGRIELPISAGRPNSIWGTEEAGQMVKTFMGNAKINDFRIVDGAIAYSGPTQWGYRRFILHYAWLCKLAGGVDEFLIGSELPGLSSIKAQGMDFPFVNSLVELAGEVRQILGNGTKIGYAADWSEYFGYCPSFESGSRYFHLDKLWADKNIDFIGIDNYMPLSDWRPETDHADKSAGSVYELSYLMGNIEGGEGYDWYYKSEVDRKLQIRTPIDDFYGEDWVWRYKDLKNWWTSYHFNRVNGVKEATQTSWLPRSKPFYFCEYGAAAVDLATNEPNKFLDTKSSESHLPHFSNGKEDSYLQAQYITALNEYWASDDHNIYSDTKSVQMLDMDKCYAWCWDARPWPEFPGRPDLWSDAENYERGHWLNGRVSASKLSNVVKEICAPLGEDFVDVSKLYGLAIGIAFRGDETIGERLDRLMQVFHFNVFMRGGKLHFVSRGFSQTKEIDKDWLIASENGDLIVSETRNLSVLPRRFEVNYVDASSSYELASAFADYLDASSSHVESLEVDFAITEEQARALANASLVQFQAGRERISFELAHAHPEIEVGDEIRIEGYNRIYIIDRQYYGNGLLLEGFALAPATPEFGLGKVSVVRENTYQGHLWMVALDLPFGAQNCQQVYQTSEPWAGPQILSWRDYNQFDVHEIAEVRASSNMGKLLDTLESAQPNRLSRNKIRVNFLQFEQSYRKLPHMRLGVIALKSSVGCEYIGFDYVEPIGKDIWSFSGLYRGMFGSSVSVHDAGTEVILLDPVKPSLRAQIFGENRSIRLISTSVADETLETELDISKPIEALRPLAPCHLKMHGRELRFTPRFKGDFDYWFDETLFNRPQSYEVRIFDPYGGQIQSQVIHEPICDIGSVYSTPGLRAQITAFNEHGRSKTIEEVIT